MSHITLEEYIASLPQSLSETKKIEKANEWKQTHQPKEEKVEVEEVETIEKVKEPAVAEKDTTVTAETKEVSDPSDSGDGELESQEIKPGEFQVGMTDEQLDATRNYQKQYENVAKTNEVYSPKNDDYEYKFSVNDQGGLDYLTRKKGEEDFIKASKLAKFSIADIFDHLNENQKKDLELYKEQLKKIQEEPGTVTLIETDPKKKNLAIRAEDSGFYVPQKELPKASTEDAMKNFEKRTGRKPSSFMELTDEDYIIQDPTLLENSITESLIGQNKQKVLQIREVLKGIKSGAYRAISGILRGPTLINEMIFTTIVDDKTLELYNSLDVEKRQKILNKMVGMSMPVDNSNIINYMQGVSTNFKQKSDAINETMVQYDQGIGELFGEGFKEADGRKVWDATVRMSTEALKSLPSLVQAVIPYVGLGSIVVSESALSSLEKQEEGEDLSGKLNINSLIHGVAEAGSDYVLRGIGKRVFKAIPKDAALKSIKQIVGQVAKDFGAEGSSESITLLVNKLADSYFLDDEKAFVDFWSELIDTFLIGGALGGKLSAGGAVNTVISQNAQARQVNRVIKDADISSITEFYIAPKATENSIKLSQNPTAKMALDKAVQAQVDSGDISIEKGNEIKNNFRQTEGAVNTLTKLDISEASQPAMVDLIIEQKALKQEIKEADNSSLTKEQSTRLAEIDTQLGDLVTQDKAKKIDIGAKKIAEEIGVGFESFETQEDVDSAIATLEEEGGDIDTKNSDNYGTFVVLPGGRRIIILNKQTATEDKVFTEGQHETGHAVVYETVKNKPEAAVALGQALLNEIRTNKDINIKPGFQARLDQYIQDADISQADTMEEVMTLVSDGLTEGTIEINETIGVKLGNFIRRALSAMGMKVKFKNGKDVLNFIKDYNRSVHRQQGLSKGLKKTAIEGAEVTITPDAVTETEIKESVAKESKRVEDSQEVQKIYDEQGAAGAIDIIAKFKPITNKIVEARSQAPNFDRQLLTDEIETGKRGIFDLITEYKPESGVPLAAYINKFLPARAIEASKRVLGEEFTADVTEAKGVVAEEVTEVVEEKPTKLTKPSSLLPIEAVTEITEQVKEKIKGIDPKNMTFKKLGDLAPEVIAREIGIPVKKLTDPRANLSKADATAIQQFVNKNADKLLRILPEGSVTEAATDDILGTSTGVPTGLLKAFYTKGKRGTRGAGLTPFIKNKNISKADFLEAFGIVEGKKAEGFSARSPQAQALKGIASLYGRLVTNEVSRSPEVGLKPEAKQKVAAGKAKTMASKRKAVEDINIFIENQAFEKVSDELAAENKRWSYIAKTIGVDYISSKNPKDVKKMQDWVVNVLAPRIQKSFFTNGTFANAGVSAAKRNFFFTSGMVKRDGTLGELGVLLKDAVFAKENENITKAVSRETYVTGGKEGKISKRFIKKFNTKQFKKEQQAKLKGLKDIFNVFETLMKEDKNNASFIIALLSSTSQGMGHFVRTSAPIKFYAKDVSSGIVEEHTMPASLVSKYLFKSAFAETLNKDFKNIEKNYFQGALSDASDKKLKGKKPNGEPFNYTEMTPEGWKLTDNIWARYFNINVANTRGGINPGNIVLSTGKTVLETFNITPSGLIINNETKNQIRKVEALNASSQPTALADPQASTQQQVYNQGILDNALNEGRKLDTPVKKFEVKQETLNKLGLSTPQQIAIYVAEKASKGFNSFTFDKASLGRSKAVKDILNQIDVKSKVQVAKASKRKTFDTVVNDMIESSSGIESYKKFSAAKAKTIGRDKGRFDFMTLASSAEDFKGLLYRLLGDGKQGEAQYEFLKTNLIDPYNRAEDAIVQAKISAANDFMALKKQFKGLPKTLETETSVGKFTYQHALRTYMWTQQGMSIPGLSKADARKLNKFITDDAKLQAFADQLISIQKGKLYPEPGKDWLGGNLTTDIIGGINKVNRAEYQQQWRENVEIIFSPENLNKMEAAYGTRWRKALENTLKRMKAGTNRLGYNDATSNVLDWVNNSVGAVMFLNTRSAVLQTISAVNFINWGDNNIIKAGAAFANQKQFWSDFMKLMNSDYLTQRRNGLKINVSESEIADAVKDSKNKVKAAIAYLLSKGFVFTRYADSFAIASGGATFYRNRIKKYLKEGMSQELAQEKAFNDFRDIAEESQQSSSPDKISMQQASAAGRIILNWANTPMQYVRIQKRALQDLIAGRGDAKVHVSRIAYYGVMQNLIFNALQQALFAIGFGDDDEDEAAKKKQDDKKIARVANGMIDSQLKGLGIAGAAMVAAKNTIMKIYEESGKNRPEFEKAAIEALSFSPAISSKYRKIVGGLKSFSWNRKEMKEKGFSLDNPAYLAGAQIITAVTNIPIDRVIKKANNIRGIMSEQSQMWQKVSMSLGWSAYDVGLPYYGGWDKPKEPTEAERKKQEIDVMKRDTNTSEQTQMLLDLGLTKKQIKALRYEDARVKKIIQLQKKKKDAK